MKLDIGLEHANRKFERYKTVRIKVGQESMKVSEVKDCGGYEVTKDLRQFNGEVGKIKNRSSDLQSDGPNSMV